MLALAKNICSLNQAEQLLEEVIIVNNASTLDYSALISFINQNKSIPFKYYESKENLGVAKGRNYALNLGHAPIVIMLDDDAEMGNANCLQELIKVFEQNKPQRPLALVSFKVLYYESGEIQKNAFPHKKFNLYRDKHYFLTYYFAGGAHAVKREVLNQIGHYPTDFFYGMEEYDLSYRILDSGYSIAYSDEMIMLHKESPLGRKPKKEKMAMLWINKATVAWRYLPLIYFMSTSLLWSVEYLLKTGFDLKGWLKCWSQIVSIPAIQQRNVIKKDTLQYLQEVNARLWY